MPRAARAILAIACSAGALRPDVGLVAPNAFPCARSKQIGALKHKWRTRLRAGYEQEELSPCNGVDENFNCFPEVDICSLSDDLDSGDADEPSDSILPEAMVIAVMTYAGVKGRRTCRLAREQCDAALHDSLQLPEFPMNVRIKQHYTFGTELPVTSTWSLEVPNASSIGFMELVTQDSGEEEVVTSSHKSEHSNDQMVSLWKQLQMLRSEAGVQHKESGNTQVEIQVTDATQRVFLDHDYRRRAFYSKADEILEVLSESDTVETIEFVDDKVESGVVPSRYYRSANRPISNRNQ